MTAEEQRIVSGIMAGANVAGQIGSAVVGGLVMSIYTMLVK